MIQERAEMLKSFDGIELFFRVYTPEKKSHIEPNIKGVVLAVHGFGEHSGRYLHVAKAVCAKNLAFALFDIRGHGQSGPRKGDAENLHALILDVIFISNHVKQILGLTQLKDSFFGLMGHSFGSLLVTYAAAHMGDSCPPLFLSSPCYGVRQEIPGWKKVLAKEVSNFAPQISAPIGIPTENLSNNKESNNAAHHDPLRLRNITARMGSLFLNAVNEKKIIQAIRLISVPVRIVAAGDDRLVKTEVTKKMMEYFSHLDTKLDVIPNAGHEIFNETTEIRNQALDYLLEWLELGINKLERNHDSYRQSI